MTLIWGIVLGLLGLIRWGPVLVAGLTIASITYGATLGVFLLGTWNRRANEAGALVGFVTGLVTMVAVRFLAPLAWTWYVLVGTVITFAVGSLASMFANGASKETRAPQPL
jgi:Na+/proline symporter